MTLGRVTSSPPPHTLHGGNPGLGGVGGIGAPSEVGLAVGGGVVAEVPVVEGASVTGAVVVVAQAQVLVMSWETTGHILASTRPPWPNRCMSWHVVTPNVGT